MRCEEALEYLHLEADGEPLGREAQRLLNEHLSGCEACQRTRDELVALSKMLSAVLPQPASVDFASQLRERVARPRVRWQQRLIGLSVHPAMRVAAAACLALVFGYALPLAFTVLPPEGTVRWWAGFHVSLPLPASLRPVLESGMRILSAAGESLVTRLAEVGETLSESIPPIWPPTAWMAAGPPWWAWTGFVLAAAANLALSTPVLARLRRVTG